MNPYSTVDPKDVDQEAYEATQQSIDSAQGTSAPKQGWGSYLWGRSEDAPAQQADDVDESNPDEDAKLSEAMSYV